MYAGVNGSQDGSSTCEEVATELRICLRLGIGFSFRSFQRLCLRRLNLLIVGGWLAKLRDNVADAGLAVSLVGALQDVLDTVDHLLV